MLQQVNGKAVTKESLTALAQGVQISTLASDGTRVSGTLNYARYEEYNGGYGLCAVLSGGKYYQTYGMSGEGGSGPTGNADFAASATMYADSKGILFEVKPGIDNGIQIIQGNLLWQKDGAVYNFASGTLKRGAVEYYGGAGSTLEFHNDSSGNPQECFKNTNASIITSQLTSRTIFNDGLNGFTLADGVREISCRTDADGNLCSRGDVACDRGTTIGTLLAGSQLLVTADSQLIVSKGEMRMGQRALIKDGLQDGRMAQSVDAAGSGESQSGLVEVNSEGVFRATEEGYIAEKGSIVSIRGGSLVVEGIGTKFYAGSQLRDGQSVRSGILQIKGDYTDQYGRTNLIYAAYDGTARTSLGGVTVNYNEGGVSSAYMSRSAASVLGGQLRGYSVSGTITTYFAKGQAKGYSVLAHNAEGGLIVSHTSWNNVVARKTVTKTVTVGNSGNSMADFKRMEYGDQSAIQQREDINVSITHEIYFDTSGNVSNTNAGMYASKANGARLDTRMVGVDNGTLGLAQDGARTYAFSLDFANGTISAFSGTAYSTNAAGDFRMMYGATQGVLTEQWAQVKEVEAGKAYWSYGTLNYDSSVFISNNYKNQSQYGKSFAPRSLAYDENKGYMVGAQLVDTGFALTRDEKTGTVINCKWNANDGYLADSFTGKNGVRSDAGVLQFGGKTMDFTVKDGKIELTDADPDKPESYANYAFTAEGKDYTINQFAVDPLSCDINIQATLDLKQGQSTVFDKSRIQTEVVSTNGGGESSSSKPAKTGVLVMRADGGSVSYTCTEGHAGLGVEFGIEDAFKGSLEGNMTLREYKAGTELQVVNDVSFGVSGSAELLNSAGEKYSVKMVEGSSVLTIAGGTTVMIGTNGGIVSNLGGVKEGRVDFRETFTLSGRQADNDVVSRTLSATNGSIKVGDISVNGADVSDSKLNLGGDYHMDLSKGSIASGLEINDTLKTIGDKISYSARSAWDAIGGGWGLAKIAAGVAGTVAGAAVAVLAGWTGVGAVAGGALIAASLSLIGVGGITYAQTGDAKQAIKEGAISAAFAALPGVGGLVGKLAGGIAVRAAGEGLIATVARTSVKVAQTVINSRVGQVVAQAGKVANGALNPLARGWTDDVAGAIVGRMATYAEGKAATTVLGRTMTYLASPAVGATGEALKTSMSTLLRMGTNAAVYKGVIPQVYRGATGKEVSSEYNAVANLAVLSPLMLSGMGPVSKAGKALISRETGAEIVNAAKSLTTREGLSKAFSSFMGVNSIKSMSLKSIAKGMAEGYNPLNLMTRTMGIVSDVALFQTGSSAVLGAVNTALGGALGYDGKTVLGIFTISKYDSFTDALTRLSTGAVDSVVNTLPFAAIMAGAQPLLGPLVRSIPGIGPMMEWLGSKDGFIGGKLAQGRLGRWQGFVYEEAFKEQIPQMLIGNRIFPPNSTANEVFQELFDKDGGISLANKNFNTVSSKLGDGYVGTIDATRSLNENSVQGAQDSINTMLAQNGSKLSVRIDSLPLGTDDRLKVSIIDRTLPGVPVIANDSVRINSVAELKNFMMNIGAAAGGNGAMTGGDLAQRVIGNSVLLNGNASDLKGLSTEQKIDYVSGMRVFSGSDFSDQSIAETQGVKDAASYVQGIVPAIRNIRNADRKQQIIDSVKREMAAIAGMSRNAGTVELASQLSNLGAYVLDSGLPRATKTDIAGSLMQGLAITADLATEDPNKVYSFVENLDMLAVGIAGLKDQGIMTLFAAAVNAHPELKPMVQAWHLKDMVAAQAEERQTRDSLLSVMSISEKLDTAAAAGILDTLNDPALDRNTKILLAHYAATILLNTGSPDQMTAGDAVRKRLMQAVSEVVNGENSAAQNALLIDTIAKLDKGAGVIRTAGTESKNVSEDDVLGEYVARNQAAYESAKTKNDEYYGKTVAVNAELKATVNTAAEVFRILKNGKNVENALAKALEGVDADTRAGIMEIVSKYAGEADAAEKTAAEIIMSDIAGKVRQFNASFKDFNEPQKDAFRKIAAQLLSEKDSKRYTHVLQTGGGKTFLVALSALLMRMQTVGNGQFIGAFTNTIDNAKDIAEHLNGIFGNGAAGMEGIGKVLVLSGDDVEKARNNPQELESFRQRLADASVVVTTYDIWSGLVASDFAQLLADEQNPQQSARIRELLESNGIKISKDRTGRMNIEDATRARDAAKLLVEAAAKDSLLSQTLNRTMIPLDKIGDAVADEIDFFSTIPMQALAKAMGKYYSAQTLAAYYTELSKIREGDAKGLDRIIEKYRDIGIDESRIRKDSRNRASAAGAAALYAKINELILSQTAPDKILRADGIASAVSNLKLSREQIAADIREFVANDKAQRYFGRLAEVTRGLHVATNASKGSIKLGSARTDVSDFWASLKDAEEKNSFINEIMNMESGEAEEDVKQLEKKVAAESASAVDMKAVVKTEAAKLKAEFGDLFSEREIVEHLWNGAGAHGMVQGREYVVRNGRIIVTNLGREVENLSLPAGMMQVLEAEHNVDVSKPNVESYVSNSVFAMSLFNNIVGLTGTVSRANETSVLERMGFVKNGNAPKASGHSRLFQTQNGMFGFIYEAAAKMNARGVANFNLLLTPDSSISQAAYSQLQAMMKADLQKIGLDADEAQTTVELLASGDTVKIAGKSAQLQQRFKEQTDAIRNIMSSTMKYIAPNVTNEELDALRKEVQAGKYKYVIGDAYLLGRGWNVGKMTDAAAIFKKDQGASQEKVQTNCWLLEPEMMTESQMLQAAGRIDPFENNRFDTAAYSKDVISLYSVENAREVKILRDAVGTDGAWNITTVLDNLEKVQLENEEEALRKAGQQLIVSRQKQWLERKEGTAAPSVKETREKLAEQGWSPEQVASIVPGTEGTLSGEAWFKVENMSRFHALLSGVMKDRETVTTIQEGVGAGGGDLEKIVAGSDAEIVNMVLAKASARKEGQNEKAFAALKKAVEGIKLQESADARRDAVVAGLGEKDAAYLSSIDERLQDPKTGVLKKAGLGILSQVKYPRLYIANLNSTDFGKNTQQRFDNLFKEIASQENTAERDAALALVAGLEVKDNALAFNERAVEKAGKLIDALPGQMKDTILANSTRTDLQTRDVPLFVITKMAVAGDEPAKAVLNAFELCKARGQRPPSWLEVFAQAVADNTVTPQALASLVSNDLVQSYEGTAAAPAFAGIQVYLGMLAALPGDAGNAAGKSSLFASVVRGLSHDAIAAITTESGKSASFYGDLAGVVASLDGRDAQLLARAINEHDRSQQGATMAEFVKGFAVSNEKLTGNPAAEQGNSIIAAIQDWISIFNDSGSAAEKAGMLAFLGLTPLGTPQRLFQTAMNSRIDAGNVAGTAAATAVPSESSLINCAVAAIQQVTGLEESRVYTSAAIGYLVDILAGTMQELSAGQPEMSMFAIKTVAERAGIMLKGMEVTADISVLKDLNIGAGGKAVVHFQGNGENSTGHFITISSIDSGNGEVTYTDAVNGGEKKANINMLEHIFNAKFSGNLLVDNRTYDQYRARTAQQASLENEQMEILEAAGAGTSRELNNSTLAAIKGSANKVYVIPAETAVPVEVKGKIDRMVTKYADAVTRPDNNEVMNAALRGLIYAYGTKEKLAVAVGVKEGQETTPEAVQASYLDQYGKLVAGRESGELTAEGFELRVAMLQTAAAILSDKGLAKAYGEIRDNDPESKINGLRDRIKDEFGTVNARVVEGVAARICANLGITEPGAQAEITQDIINELKKEIEVKRSPVQKMMRAIRRMGVSSTLDGELKDMFGLEGSFQMSGPVQKRTDMQISPLGARAVAGSA